jgi:hypothetical protein
MNSLSWMIYAIGVVDSLREIAQGLLVATGFVVLFGGIFAPLALDMLDVDNPWRIIRSAIRWIASTIAICALIVVVVPSRQTLLLIAGSEIGQRVATSDAVQDIVGPGADLLKTWIAEETAKLKGAK